MEPLWDRAGIQGKVDGALQAAYARMYRNLWERHWWWRSREAHLVATIQRLARSNSIASLLDVGCGDGLFFGALARFGTVEGLEPDATMLEDSSYRHRITVGTLGPLFQPEQAYDLVLMLDVLEHIEADSEALHHAFEVTRPGGLLMLTVPALPGLWSRHDEANQHFRRYRAEDLRAVLQGAGFEVESLRYFFAWTLGPMLLRRWLARPGSGTPDYNVSIPPAAINAILTALSKAEHALSRALPLPLGSSLLAVARRPLCRSSREPRPIKEFLHVGK